MPKVRFSEAHRIRLRGPWQQAGGDPPKRVRMPTTWREAFGNARENVALVRSFGCPDGIGPNEVVWLELDLATDTHAQLNGKSLATLAPARVRFEVTNALRSRNDLRLVLEEPPADRFDAPLVEASLVIETSAGS